MSHFTSLGRWSNWYVVKMLMKQALRVTEENQEKQNRRRIRDERKPQQA